MDEIRVITWTVSDDGLELLPEAPQFGGVQGEDNATLVRFAIGEGCPIAKSDYHLYIEVVDATGAWDRTDRLYIKGGYVTHTVPLAWTQHGGTTTLRLQAEKDGQTIYSLSGMLRFDNRAGAAKGVISVFRTLVQKALDEMRAAKDAFFASIDDHLDDRSTNPVQNKVVTDEIRYVDELATDNGKRITALSKRVTDLEEAEPIVDEELSPESENPVQNKVVAGAISDLNELVNDVESDLSAMDKRVDVAIGDLSNVKKDVDSLMQSEQDIENIPSIDSRVSAIEKETIPDLAKRVTHIEDNAPIVDEALSTESTNPVQNKVITEAFGNIDDRLQAVERNGGGGGGGNIVVDDKLDPASTNPVENRVIVGVLGDMSGTVADAKSIANTAQNTASNAQIAANSAINKAKEASNKADELAGRVDGLQGSVQDMEQRTIPELGERVNNLEDNAITVDDEMSYDSKNPVQNKVVMQKISEVGIVAGAASQEAAEAINKANAANDSVGALNGRVDKVEQDLSDTLDLVNDFNGDLSDHAERLHNLETADAVASVNGQTGAVQLTAADVGARPNTWMPSHTDVGADKAGTANTMVADHNTKTDAHNDIRLLITALTKRLDALANSDDTTLDQMAEVVAYIKANRGLIEQVTTGKVSVADIVNNLTTNVTDKPLSAAQGVALKALIDELAAAANSIASIVKTATSGLVDTYTITYTNGTKSTYTVTNGADGAVGERGTGLLYVTTAPSSYTTATGGFTPVYRIALSTVLSQSKASKVLVGDTLVYSYYLYPVGYVDASYVYLGTRKSLRGATGTSVTVSGVSESTESGGSNVITFSDNKTVTIKNGSKGDKGDPYTLTEADKAEIVQMVIESLGGNPVFGYVDSDTMTIVLKNAPDGEYSLAYLKDDGTISAPIGSMVKDTNVYYTVTNTLTNCTNNNSATKAVEGGSYSATITAKSGYELKSVTATMGGSAVTVTNGKINITNVTGNIVITALAEEIKAAYTNFANPSSSDWWTDARIGSDGAIRTGCTGNIVTNYIEVKTNDIVEVEGLNLTLTTNDNNGSSRMGVYNSSKAIQSVNVLTAQTQYFTDITATSTGGQAKYTSSGTNMSTGYLKFAGKPTNGVANIIVKIKRNGAYL